MDIICLQILVPLYFSYYVEVTKMSQQTTNFIPTPSWEMIENFKLYTKHDML
jgi:hypothetical protein